MQPSQEFSQCVYSAVQQIPEGRVTSYGRIAEMIGRPRNARQVGQSLKWLSLRSDQEFNSNNVPWWRVVNSSGGISPREGNGDVLQAEKLRMEGIEVELNRVSMREYGWFQ